MIPENKKYPVDGTSCIFMAFSVKRSYTNQCLAFQESPIELLLSQTLHADLASSLSVGSPLSSRNLWAGDLGVISPSPSASLSTMSNTMSD